VIGRIAYLTLNTLVENRMFFVRKFMKEGFDERICQRNNPRDNRKSVLAGLLRT
jgi:hypothetical protein